jgi:hypothetical protein
MTLLENDPPRVKNWEIIADNLSKAGWSWGCVSTVDFEEQTDGSVNRSTPQTFELTPSVGERQHRAALSCLGTSAENST